MALAIERVTVFVVFGGDGDGDWRLAVGDPSIRSTAFVCVAAVLAASTSKNKEGTEIQMLSISASIGRHLPDQ